MTYLHESVGDNIEFTAVNAGDYTIYLSITGTDTEFAKYPLNPTPAAKFSIRSSQDVAAISYNDITLTNTETIKANSEKIETRNSPKIFKMVIRTTVSNTNLKIRWF